MFLLFDAKLLDSYLQNTSNITDFLPYAVLLLREQNYDVLTLQAGIIYL